MVLFLGVFLVFFGVHLCFWLKNRDLARPYAQVVVKNREKIGKSCQKFAEMATKKHKKRKSEGVLSIKKVDTCAFGRALFGGNCALF